MSHLTTLARAKAYLGGNISTNADSMITALIGRVSDQVAQYTGRRFAHSQVQAIRVNGTGSSRMMAPQNPILSVTELKVDGTALSVSADAQALGYQFDSKFLYLFGGAIFTRGLRNVELTYEYGFATTQDGVVPGVGPFTIAPVDGSGVGPDGYPTDTTGPAIHDHGVTYTATGTALEKVLTGPNSAGKYLFSEGTYTFHNGDANAAVTMDYDYVPGSVEQAVLEMVGAAIKRRDQQGITSRSLATETIVYDQKMLTPAVKELLQPYRFIISP